MLPLPPKARTSPVVRAEIAGSEEPTGVLAQRFGAAPKRWRQWRQRLEFGHFLLVTDELG